MPSRAHHEPKLSALPLSVSATSVRKEDPEPLRESGICDVDDSRRSAAIRPITTPVDTQREAEFHLLGLLSSGVSFDFGGDRCYGGTAVVAGRGGGGSFTR
jgi:hypothetical protein